MGTMEPIRSTGMTATTLIRGGNDNDIITAMPATMKSTATRAIDTITAMRAMIGIVVERATMI